MNIVVFNLNWLGDILFSLPVLYSIKQHYPKAHLATIVPPLYASMLTSQPYIDEVIAISDRTLFGKFRLLAQLKKKKWALGILLHRSHTRARIFKWSDMPTRVGYDTNHRASLLTHAFPEPTPPLHKMGYLLHLIEKFGIPLTKKTYSYVPPSLVFPIPKPYVVFHPGSNWDPKRWPTPHYAKLGEYIKASGMTNIVITGSRSDKKLVYSIQRRMRQSVIDLTGKTNIPQLASVLSQAQWVIAGDTGPMHLAVASGANVVALYGPTSPHLNGPHSENKKPIVHWENPGCQSYPCKDPKCQHSIIMRNLSPERVFKSIQDAAIT